MRPSNLARSSRFKFSIVDQKATAINLAGQGVPIPGVQLPGLDLYVGGKGISLPDNNMQYDPLVVDFTVSDDFREWLAIYEWMKSASSDTDHFAVYERNCILTILDSHQKPIIEFTYFACSPSDLGGINMSFVDDSKTLSSSLTMTFSNMKVKRLKDGFVIEDL